MLPSVDWQTAASCSRAFSRGGPRISPEGALDVVADLHRHARSAIDLVADYTGLTPTADTPVDVVDRIRWSRVNIAGFRRLLTELGADTGGPDTPVSASAKLTGVQTGAVLAFLSSRVLGQFETFSTDTGRLLFVAPNIVEVERRLRLPAREFRLWIAIHEAAHLTQFTAVPWMRGHFHDLIHTFFDAAEPDQSSASGLARAVRRALASARSEDDDALPEAPGSDVMAAVTSPEQRAAISQIQALMTLLEGHAESVMDGVGRTAVDHVALLRRRFDRRRANPTTLQKFMRQLLGLDAKMRQYAAGRRFVDEVVDAHGLTGFNRVWERPANLPTEAEIDRPEQWIARVLGPRLALGAPGAARV
ncbi:coenzyme F420 biosynthesis-associated protein [Glycomyces paridis]|uniref:Coenzyme F420 biosynthesis-associated protein n=2 Tax=Glycomyces paridis TaxID=2126555 RepID=A0A4S8PE74_9ACTN|nr:coenzyme F420 biosynthesis-associated protein [Glycomyces paridis]